jgi:hypothetical protein
MSLPLITLAFVRLKQSSRLSPTCAGGVVVHQDCDAFMARLAAQLGIAEPDTPETAAAYAAAFMDRTREQLTVRFGQ